jgi:hypothetical protein
MVKESLTDTVNYVVSGLSKEPLTYINTTALAVSFTSMESTLKIILYIVSIAASILVSRKYFLEITKLKREEKESKKKNNGNPV